MSFEVHSVGPVRLSVDGAVQVRIQYGAPETNAWGEGFNRFDEPQLLASSDGGASWVGLLPADFQALVAARAGGSTVPYLAPPPQDEPA